MVVSLSAGTQAVSKAVEMSSPLAPPDERCARLVAVSSSNDNVENDRTPIVQTQRSCSTLPLSLGVSRYRPVFKLTQHLQSRDGLFIVWQRLFSSTPAPLSIFSFQLRIHFTRPGKLSRDCAPGVGLSLVLRKFLAPVL